MSSQFTVIYDACVFYPAPLRDLLVQLARADFFRARWTDQIHQEWIGSLLRNRPDIKPEQLELTKEYINASTLDCLVHGYESLIEGIVLPDPNDRHVLAAAVRSGAQVIVTYNLKDFPQKCLCKFNVDAQDPDLFCRYLIDLAPGLFLGCIKNVRERLRKPPKKSEEYLKTLESMGLLQTASWLQDYKNLI